MRSPKGRRVADERAARVTHFLAGLGKPRLLAGIVMIAGSVIQLLMGEEVHRGYAILFLGIGILLSVMGLITIKREAERQAVQREQKDLEPPHRR
jgi:hypothetical protein